MGIAQIIAQFGLLSGGKNLYTVIPYFDFYMHSGFNFGLNMIPFDLVRFGGRTVIWKLRFHSKWDMWRYWIPVQIALMIAWELVELAITFFRLFSPDVMKADPWNSLFDVGTGIPSMLSVNFFREMYEQREKSQRIAYSFHYLHNMEIV
jgi:hypothetical protein